MPDLKDDGLKPIKSSAGGKESKQTSGKEGTSRFSSLNVHVSPVVQSGITAFGDKFSNIKLSRSKIIEPTDDNILPSGASRIPSNEPLILMISEFVPIYQDVNQIDRSLDLKEKSSLVVSRNAAIALTNPLVIKQIQSRTEQLNSFIEEKRSISKLLRPVSDLYELLKVKNYRSKTIEGSPKLYYLIDFFGEEKLSGYTASKIWMQMLFETKRLLQTYSSKLVSSTHPESNDPSSADPKLIVGVNGDTATESKIWINFFDASKFSLDEIGATNSSADISRLLRLIKERFENLYIDRDASLTSGIRKPAVKLIDSMSDANRDISLLATILTKELNYSRVILDAEDKLLSDYGVDIQTAPSQSVFDYLIGTFTRSAWDVPISPAGNGKALTSFAHHVVTNSDGTQSYILTLEGSYSEFSLMVPGAQFFVESSLKTTDGKSFNVENVKILKDKASKALQTIELLQSMIRGDSGIYQSRGRPSSSNVVSVDIKGSISKPESSAGGYSAIRLSERSGLSKAGIVGPLSSDISSRPTSELDSGSSALIGKNVGFYPRQLVENIFSQFDALKSIYYNLYLSTKPKSPPYSDSDASRTERLMASMLKSCIQPTRSMSTSSLSIKSYLFMIANIMMSSAHEDVKSLILDEIMKEMIKLINTPPGSPDIVLDDKVDQKMKDFFENSIVWSNILKMMKGYMEMPVFNSLGLTAFSKIDKQTLSMAYFDLILRVIASMTPDEFYGTTNILDGIR